MFCEGVGMTNDHVKWYYIITYFIYLYSLEIKAKLSRAFSFSYKEHLYIIPYNIFGSCARG